MRTFVTLASTVRLVPEADLPYVVTLVRDHEIALAFSDKPPLKSSTCPLQVPSLRQLVEQGVRLLQVWRVEAFGEPVVD
jgi:hypothetical protein